MSEAAPLRARARTLTTLATTAFVALTVLVHVLRPEVDVFEATLTRYRTDLYAGLMAVGFVLLGLALSASAYDIRTAKRPGAPLLFGAAAGSFVAAAVPIPVASDTAFLVHQTAAFVVIACAIGGAAAATGAFQPDPSARFFGPVAVAMARTAILTGALFLLGIAARRTPLNAVLGLLQRLTLAAVAIWMIAVSRRRT